MYTCLFFAKLVTATQISGGAETPENAISLLQHRSAVVIDSRSIDNSSLLQSPEDFCNSDFKLSAPVDNTLGQVNGGFMRFEGVTDEVDLIVSSTGGNYQPYDAGQNGMKNGFGNINMKTGSSAIFEFKFVKTGTEEATAIPKVSCSFYDMDEGKRGKGRGSITTCGAETSFIPSTTELSQVKGSSGCYKTTSCYRGAKGNEPDGPEGVSHDALTRTFTYSYVGKSSFKIKLESTKGSKGRNYMFSLDPIVACRLTTTTTTTTTNLADQPTCQWFWYKVIKSCRVLLDPVLMQSFVYNRVSAQSMHTQGIQRAARSKDGNFELQTFHCPLGGKQTASSVVCGIAIKIGKEVITYVGKNHVGGNGGAEIQWTNGSVIPNGSYKIPGGHSSVHIAPPDRYPGGILPPCYGIANHVRINPSDHKIKAIFVGSDGPRKTRWVLSVGYRDFKELELAFQLHMAVEDIDTTIIGEGRTGSYCQDGAELSQPIWRGLGTEVSYGMQKYSIDYHDAKNNLFGLNTTDYICANMMAANCERELTQTEDFSDSIESTCKDLNIPFAKAQEACKGYKNRKLTEACQMQYCNDASEGQSVQQIRDAAEALEEDLEADEEKLAALDRDFVPDECCEKYTCDKIVTEF